MINFDATPPQRADTDVYRSEKGYNDEVQLSVFMTKIPLISHIELYIVCLN